MAKLVPIDPNNYDIERFDMDPNTLRANKFMDEKSGKEQSYFTGELMYRDPSDETLKAPYILVEGDTYGISKANEKKDDKGLAVPAIPGMVQIPSVAAATAATAASENAEKKEKWQVAVKLSEKPAEKDWTDSEKVIIRFVDSDLRRILAHVLAFKRIEILQNMNHKSLDSAREALVKEASTPEGQQKYATETAQLQRLRELTADVLYNMISRKVYRKKKDAKKTGAPGGVALLAAGSQYDETKHPCLYAGIMSYIAKQTKKEEFITKYYKFVEGEEEANWPQMTHGEAVAAGWYRDKVAVRFDNTFFGASIASQLKAAEVILIKAIGGGMGHQGRLVKADPNVPRNQHLIVKSPIQAAGSNNNSNNYIVETPAAFVPPSFGQHPVSQSPAAQPMVHAFQPPQVAQFNPALVGIPGVTALPPPNLNN